MRSPLRLSAPPSRSPVRLQRQRGDPPAPLDPDPERCERAFVGNTIGQANAVSDRILDLRQCNYVDKDLSTKTLSGALMVDSTFKGANMTEVVMSKRARGQCRLYRRKLRLRRRGQGDVRRR